MDKIIQAIRKVESTFLDKVMSIPQLYYRGLLWKSVTSSSVLDVGCGDGFPMVGFRNTRRNSEVAEYMVGADAYMKSLFNCKSLKLYDEQILCDASILPFREKSFDTVLCLNLVEHLKKKEGVILLKEVERIARKQVILYLPVGYLPQPHKDKNIYLEHKSGWIPQELEKKGYDVRGFSGFIHFRSSRLKYYVSKYHLQYLHYFLLLLSQIIVYHIPGRAFEMFCRKNIENKEAS
jgi:ubiquinone/menaquinone biosynthesis C-methylase UbiE|tara:strand:+ start:503 stop:1207 length:705 start_codon:yes stop_codon:yes gene_type:complete